MWGKSRRSERQVEKKLCDRVLFRLWFFRQWQTEIAARRRTGIEGIVLNPDSNGFCRLDGRGRFGNPKQGQIGSSKGAFVGVAVAMLYFCFRAKRMNCRNFIEGDPDNPTGERSRQREDRQHDDKPA